jgi:hypothetical protein
LFPPTDEQTSPKRHQYAGRHWTKDFAKVQNAAADHSGGDGCKNPEFTWRALEAANFESPQAWASMRSRASVSDLVLAELIVASCGSRPNASVCRFLSLAAPVEKRLLAKALGRLGVHSALLHHHYVRVLVHIINPKLDVGFAAIKLAAGSLE